MNSSFALAAGAVLVAGLCTGCATGTGPGSQTLDPQRLSQSDSGVTEYVLDNGMKILVQPDRRAPVVVSQVWYKVGSSYEHNGITGISHVLEHMMFKGTDDLEPGEFSEIIAANGGRENAFTGYDYTAYFQQIAADRLDLVLGLEAERMRDLIITEAEFEKEVEVVKEERRLRTEDRPPALTYERFAATAYTSSPYQHPIIGWMEDLDSLTVERTRRWYQTWYAPNNATLVVVGDVAPAQVIELARKHFGPLQPSELAPAPDRREAAQLGPRRAEVHAPAELPYLVLGYKTPSLRTAANEDDAYALAVLAGVLDSGKSARLARELVRGRELAASASAHYDLYARLDNMLVLDAVPAGNREVAELIEALRGEIARLQREPVSAAELERIKAQVIASDVYERDSMFYQAMKLGVLETVGLGWRKLDEYVERIQAVTPEQVQAVAQRYLRPESLTIAELVPQRSPEPARGRGSAGTRHMGGAHHE